MGNALLRFFFQTIFLSRRRQKLLLLALMGLFISSFALLVLQSAMGGLQGKLIDRSKSIEGLYVLEGDETLGSENLDLITKSLESMGVTPIKEFELELLLQAGAYLSPTIVHGLDLANLPDFLALREVELNETILTYDLASKIGAGPSELVRLISPAHTDFFLTEVPRSVSVRVERLIATDVPDIDSTHLWVKATSLYNLTRQKKVNRIRIYQPLKSSQITELKEKFKNWNFVSWEQRHETLVWALGLETTVMVFLFTVMSLLVALCIVSGLFLFFDKIKWDLAGLWILGASKNRLKNASASSLMVISASSCGLGVIAAILFLKLFATFGIEILPAVFIDREIPIHITTIGILTSFFVPCVIAWIFSFWSLKQFHQSQDHLSLIRSAS